MVTLTMRSYKGETDWQAIAELVNACQTVDQLDEEATAYELKLKLNAPSFDRSRDVQLWENDCDRLLGLALLDMSESQDAIDAYLWFYVHPSVGGEGLEKDLIEWGSRRLQAVANERGLPAKLRTYSRDRHISYKILLEQQNFVSDRCFLTMARTLSEPIPKPQFPEKFRLLHMTGEEDIQPWVEMFNASFIDHWNHHDLTVEKVRHWMKDCNYQPELDLIAVAPDGTFAACCDCQINPENNQEGWIEFLGTRRGFRQMGLGKAMLLAGMNQLQAAGANIVKLSVDADSLTGATHLYKSVGFHTIDTWLAWVKTV